MRSVKSLLPAVLCLVLAACAAQRREAPSPPPGGLAGTSWRLVEFRSSDDAIGVVRPADRAGYTIDFGTDGRVSMRLDCNRASGAYAAVPGGGEGGTLTFGPLAMTRAFCGEQSLDTQIARHAEFIRTYLLRDGRLDLDLMADGGTYAWEPADGVR